MTFASSVARADDDEVVVAGTRVSHTAGSVQVVDKQKLERFEYDDPGAILQQVPGVYWRGEDGIGLRPNLSIRGGNPDRSKKLTLMEDGILFGPAPYSAPAAYYFPLVTRMTQVRVIKGPAAISYGPQTVGGAIDFVSRPIPIDGRLEGAVDLAAGEYGYGKLHAYGGWGDEKMGVLVEGVRLENDGFTKLPSGADTGSTRNDWMVKAGYTLDPHAKTKHRFQLKLSYGDEVSNETYLGQSDADFRSDPYRRYPASALDQMRNHRTGVVVSHVIDGPESQYKLETKVYRFDYARTWRKLNRLGNAGAAEVLQNPNDPSYAGYYGVITGRTDSSTAANTLWVGPNDRRFVSQGVQTVLSTTTRTGPIDHRLEAGVRLHYDEIKRLHSETAYLMQGGELVNANEPTLTVANNRASTYALATHLTDAMSWRGLTVTPGARVEVIASKVEERGATRGTDTGMTAVVLPGVGAYYEITRELGVLGGVHRGFSPPPPGSGNDVRPEYSVAYEAGARYTRGAARFEVIGFVNDYSNLTDVCTLASGCVAANLDRQFDAGKAVVRGLEVYGTYEPRLRRYDLRFPVTAAYTLTEGWFQNSFTSQDPIYGNVRENDDIPYIPLHQLNVTGAVEHRRAGANVAVTYVSPMREVAGRGAVESALHTDEQLWADVGAYVAPLRWLRIYANWRNIFGGEFIVGHRPYGARPNAPRWLQVGMKATF
ncbi:MAG: TonB-dependent receptor [Labilithrix sp.]|nr:TonB-dependent receptor [Labilithrix sp.]MCW5811124.1 TonB-dependent receptor [Labilithrix sp.]